MGRWSHREIGAADMICGWSLQGKSLCRSITTSWGSLDLSWLPMLAGSLLPIPNVRIFRLLKYASAMVKIASTQGSFGHLRKYGLFKIEGVMPTLERYIDMALVLNLPSPLFVTVRSESKVKRPLGESRWFKLQEQTESDAWNIIGASMAVPLVFSPIEINGQTYSDGGVGHWLPIGPLYESGVRNIIAISTKAEFSLDKSKYPGCRIVTIGPKKSLGRFPLATFRFTEAAVLAWIEEGYRDGLDALKTLKL